MSGIDLPETKRRPCRLAFSFPPTESEIAAFLEIKKARALGQILSCDHEDGRIIIMVEWIGNVLPPEVLSYKQHPKTRPLYEKIGVRTKGV